MDNSTSNCPVGTVVWCYDRNEFGKIVHDSTLGISRAPTVQTETGTKVMYCGDNKKNYCEYIPVITDTMISQGYTQQEVDDVRKKWYNKTKAQRFALFCGLTGTPREQIDSLLHQL